MTDQKITIVAKILTKAEQRDFVKDELLKLVAHTKVEEGCIEYSLNQDNENSNLFFVYENWANREMLQKHLESVHFTKYVKTTDGATEDFIVNEMTHIA